MNGDTLKASLEVYYNLMSFILPSNLFPVQYSFSSEMNCERPKPGIILGTCPIPHHLHLSSPVCTAGRVISQQCNCVRSQALRGSPNTPSINCPIAKVAPRTMHGLALYGSSASFHTTPPITVCTLTTLAYFLLKQATSSSYTECVCLSSQPSLPQ